MVSENDSFRQLLDEIRQCRACEGKLPLGANPVVEASQNSSIIVIGQAPGRIVHETGIPWNDKSGNNLRNWLGVDKNSFYDTQKFALVPMGFCYPGTGKSGDFPPRPECAPLWQTKLMEGITDAKMIVLVGAYSQQYYLKGISRKSLTETVKGFLDYLPTYFPLPHPSPRNNLWQAKNKWFPELVLPVLKQTVEEILRSREQP